MNKLIFTFAVAVLIPRFLVASEPAFSRFPGGAAAWTVALTYAAPKQPSQANEASRALVEKIEVTQSGEFQRSCLVWTDGKVTEQWHWIAMKCSVVQDSNGSVMRVSDYDRSRKYMSVVDFGESRFAWIEPKFLKGEVSHRGKQCLYYEGMAESGEPIEDGADSPALVPVRAWIEKETLLPVAFANQEVSASFAFLPPPSSPLSPPKAIADEVNRYQRALAPPVFLPRKERRASGNREK